MQRAATTMQKSASNTHRAPERAWSSAAWAMVMCVALGAVAALDASPAQADGGGSDVRRFALVVGANYGGGDRAVLRYATSDAKAISKVLGELGGVSAKDRVLVINPTRDQLLEAAGVLGGRMAQARGKHRRVELIMYYSGHSDEQGLLLHGERLGYKALRKTLNGLPADVRIAVLDSCASGALTRTKGGRKRPSFLDDASIKVSGHAFLTSSAEDEVAQESDTIGASFFTYYFLSALRGAADVTGDQRVTLTEAYRFAFDETLARTESTRSGPQHPAFDIQLVGSGDLVLTDLRQASAGLLVDEALEGRMFIRDDQGQLVLELFKAPGRPVELSLEPGDYVVSLEQGDSLSRASVALKTGGRTPLVRASFEAMPREATATRGDAAGLVAATTVTGSPEILHRPFNISLVPGLGVGHYAGWDSDRTSYTASLGVFLNHSARADGVAISGLMNWHDQGASGLQIAGLTNHAEDDAHGVRISGLGNISLGVTRGVQIGGIGNYNEGTDPNFGLSVGGTFNFARGPMWGIQTGGVFNHAAHVEGAQIGGIANNTGYVSGLQLGGIGNLARGRVDGAQVAGIGNIAEDVTGPQVGGIFNVAENVTGAQIGGLFNAAEHVEGVQVGLVNVADSMDGAPIGLVNIIGDGIHEVGVAYSDVLDANLQLKLGSRYFYTFLNAGIDATPNEPPSAPRRSRSHVWGFDVGFGGRVPISDRLFTDIDLSTGTIQSGSWDNERLRLHNQLRLGVGYRFFDHLTVTAGPTLHTFISDDDSIADGVSFIPVSSMSDIGEPGSAVSGDGSFWMAVWPGFFASASF